MNPFRICVALGTLGALVSLGPPLTAAEGGRTLSASGVAKVELRPSLLRARIQLSAKGKTAREALAKLNDRREAARVKLAALGAVKERIKIADPIAAPVDDNQRPQVIYSRPVVTRLTPNHGLAAKKPKVEVKPPIRVVATLTAEWPLAEASADDTLALVEELREKIVDADLAGLTEVEKLTPEEEELAAEMADPDDSFSGFDGNARTKPGEPELAFVARISAAEREKLLATAYRDAHAKAQELAGAVTAKLGDLATVYSTDNSNRPSGASGMYDPWRRYQMDVADGEGFSVMEDEEGGDGAKTYEVWGPAPTRVQCVVTVETVFELK